MWHEGEHGLEQLAIGAETGRGRELWASSIEGRCCYQSPCLEYGEQNQELVEGLHETLLDGEQGQEL